MSRLDWRQNTIFAFFDLATFPSGEEIFPFVLLAEIERRERNFEALHLVVIPEGSAVSVDSRRNVDGYRSIYEMFSGIVMMMPTIKGYTICDSRADAIDILAKFRGHTFPALITVLDPCGPSNDTKRASEEMFSRLQRLRSRIECPPVLEVPQQAKEYVEVWLKNAIEGRPFITVTLAGAQSAEVAQAFEACSSRFLEQFNETEYAVILVVSQDRSMVPLPENLCHRPVFPGAEPFSALRLALYRRAHLNLVEMPESKGFCGVDELIRCVCFGDGSDACADGCVPVDGYDAVAIEAACQEVISGSDRFSNGGAKENTDDAQVMSIDSFFRRALELHAKGGAIDQAIRIYSAILKVNPLHAGALGMLGVCAYSLGDGEHALSLIKNAIDLEGMEPAHRYNLGNLFVLLGRETEAVASYRAALAIDPDMFDAWESLASVLFKLGRFQEAADCYGEAIKGPRRSIETRFNYAQCLTRLDLSEQATEMYYEVGSRYLDFLDDEDIANAMSGYSRRRPYSRRNAAFLLE